VAEWLRQHGAFTVILTGLVAALIYGLVRKHDVKSYDAVFLLSFVFAVVLHEVSHGVMALWCGDTTAKDAKRLTLNPIRHVDLFGSIILPVILVITTGTPFGWAKPVPVNLANLRHPRNQAVYVGLIGPVTNIVLSIAAGLLYHLFYVPVTIVVPSTATSIDVTSYLPLGAQILMTFGLINLILAVFNLFPIPPLDGSALLERLLPKSWLAQYYRMRMGFLIVVLLFVFVFQHPLDSIFNWFETQWLNAVGANGDHAVNVVITR
jgi:Zn-dependent protease